MTMVTVTGSVSVSCECECECIFCSWGVARYSRERGGLTVFRDGRRDNDDATSNSITCSYVLIYVLVMGVRLGVLLWFDCCSSRRSYVRYYRDDMLR